MLFMALPMGIGSFAIFLMYHQQDLSYARTMTLLTMAMFQWFNTFNCRSTHFSLFSIGFFSNWWLVIANLFVLFLQCCLLYIPAMRYIFKTVPLSGDDWMIIIVVSSTILFVEEIRKYLMRRKEGL